MFSYSTRFTLVVIVCAAGALLATRAHATVRQVAVLGDSIVAAGAFTRALEQELGRSWRVHNYGVASDSPGQMAARVRHGAGDRAARVLDPSRYEVVVVLGGVNGIGVALDERSGARTQLNRLFSLLRKPFRQRAPRIVALTLPPWGGWPAWSANQQNRTEELNRWLLGKATDASLPPPDIDAAIDLYGCFRDPAASQASRPRMRPAFTFDGLHFSRAAAEEAARRVRDAFRQREWLR